MSPWKPMERNEPREIGKREKKSNVGGSNNRLGVKVCKSISGSSDKLCMQKNTMGAKRQSYSTVYQFNPFLKHPYESPGA